MSYTSKKKKKNGRHAFSLLIIHYDTNFKKPQYKFKTLVLRIQILFKHKPKQNRFNFKILNFYKESLVWLNYLKNMPECHQ